LEGAQASLSVFFAERMNYQGIVRRRNLVPEHAFRIGPGRLDHTIQVFSPNADILRANAVSWQSISLDPPPDGRRTDAESLGCLSDAVEVF